MLVRAVVALLAGVLRWSGSVRIRRSRWWEAGALVVVGVTDTTPEMEKGARLGCLLVPCCLADGCRGARAHLLRALRCGWVVVRWTLSVVCCEYLYRIKTLKVLHTYNQKYTHPLKQ